MALRLSLLLVVGCVSLVSSALAEDEIKDDFFSYQVPVGWQIFTLPKITHPMAMDKSQEGFKPYIQIDHSPSTQSLADFVTHNKETLKKMVPSTQFISEQPFVTTSGTSGVRIVVKSHVGANDLEPIYYLFEGADRTKYAVFANCLASSFDQYEPIFDGAMKTLVIK